MRLMYDSVDPAAIPADADMVAGYLPPSRYAWSAAQWEAFPRAHRITITPSADNTTALVLDVENGDATPAQAPAWAAAREAAGVVPTVYCSAAAWQDVQDAFTTAGQVQPLFWVAAYPGTGANLPTLNGHTAIAHQYADSTSSGGDYDLSVVADFWPGVDTPLPGDAMSGLNSPWIINQTEGRAYASFEVGSNSQVVTQLWVGLKALYGELTDVSVVFTNDLGQQVAAVSSNQAGGTLAANQRWYWQAGSGASDVTIQWTPAGSTGLAAPYLVYGA